MNFASDNTAGAHPKVIEAIVAANGGTEPSYGADRWSQTLDAALSDWFGRQAFVFPVATGGAANALALAQIAPPWGAIFCHRESHIQVDECGAPEFFTAGAKLVPLDGVAAKLGPDALRTALHDHPAGVVHRIQPGAVSLTNATECGTLYRPEEISQIAGIAHEAGMKLHMDGARLANALATLGCAPADLTWKAGIDVLSLGFTKNGAMAAEAVVFFDEAVARDFNFRRKRGGHLFSKMRFFAAQFLALLEGGLWRDLAAAANASALALADVFQSGGHKPAFAVEANEVFVALPRGLAAALQGDGARFYPWGREDGPAPLYRFVCSFATESDEISRFADRYSFHGRSV